MNDDVVGMEDGEPVHNMISSDLRLVVEMSKVLLQVLKDFWRSTRIHAVVKIEDLFKASLASLRFAQNPFVALVKPGLVFAAGVVGALLLDLGGGVDQVLLVLLLFLILFCLEVDLGDNLLSDLCCHFSRLSVNLL